VLLCASAVQAGIANLYTFDNLTNGYVNGQVDTAAGITWRSAINPNYFVVANDPNNPGNKWALPDPNRSKQEQDYTSMTDPNVKASLFGLSSTDTHVRISFTTRMNTWAGGMIGIWVDGADGQGVNNTMQNSNGELLCQFGMSSSAWRIRGAAGQYSVVDLTGLPTTKGQMPMMKLTLDIDILGNDFTGGTGIPDGSISMSITNLDTGVVYEPQALQGGYMDLENQSAYFRDPSKWTGWWYRGQQSATLSGNATYCPWGYTTDNLTIEVIPEPATLGLVVVAGLACLRRRRSVK